MEKDILSMNVNAFYLFYKGRHGKVLRMKITNFFELGRNLRRVFYVKRTEFRNGAVLSTVLLSTTPFSSRPTYETIYFPSPDDAQGISQISPESPLRFNSKQDAQRAHRAILKKLAFFHKSYGKTKQGIMGL